MATILNIETSTRVCSVALTSDGYILTHREDFEGPNHATLISGFIKDCMDYCREHDGMKIDAVAVSLGPGSYTGLRIGLSEAKGLAYGLKVPLIGISTLEIIAVEAMFSLPDFDPENDVFVPMLDARRDEVYTTAYDGMLTRIVQDQAMILTAESVSGDFDGRRVFFVGNGAAKAEKILAPAPNHFFIPGINPLATSMCALAEKAYLENRFIDVAYSTPIYLKDFIATKPKKNLGL